MDFSFTDEQNAMAKMLTDFAKKELLPKYTYWDRQGEFPREQIAKMAELGLAGLRISPEYGGQEVDYITTGLVIEEIAKGDFSCANALITYAIVGEIIQRQGTEKVKNEWLPLLARGEKIPALVLTEPHCGSDAAALRAKAIKKGNSYILSGEKSAGTLLMSADGAVIFAKTDPEAGARGVSAFWVPADLPGITRQSYEDMGAKGIMRGSIFLDDVEIPAENLLGGEGEGFVVVMAGFDYTRILLGLICIGAAKASLEETIRYVKERHAFGVPLAKFEGVSFPIAEHYSRIEAARMLCYRGLWLRNQGLPHTTEAAICKWMGPKFAVDAIHDCLLLHGHYGYTQEFPIEQRLRDAIGLELGDGPAQIQKIVISRDLFGREYLPY